MHSILYFALGCTGTSDALLSLSSLYALALACSLCAFVLSCSRSLLHYRHFRSRSYSGLALDDSYFHISGSTTGPRSRQFSLWAVLLPNRRVVRA